MHQGLPEECVSIPERDFSRFPDRGPVSRVHANVSIPERDFSRFPVFPSMALDTLLKFQSLKGILVDFQMAGKLSKFTYISVSIPERDFSRFPADQSLCRP